VAFGLEPNLSRAAAQCSLTRIFAEAGIESAALDARILVCAALAIDHAALVRDPDLSIGDAVSSLEAFASRRIKHEPVSRIIGRREFFGETYAIDPAVLDPRPDTECLVEAVIEAVGLRKNHPLRVLDLGIGSGAILGALLSQLPHATGIGIDLSPEACSCARANLSRMGLAERSSIITGHWMAPIKGHFDLIVSNPPYIASADIAGLAADVRGYDPHLALDGGADGLTAYRDIASALTQHLAQDAIAAFEFGEGQRDAIESILCSAGLKPVGSRRDLAGRDRVILARAR
jgi:release factor glutamine methyltransferase